MKPLVSVLIPTYNRPYYFKQALNSALKQTYPNIEIIVCDNSDNNQTERIVKTTSQPRPIGSKIIYIRNKKNIGPIANQQQCLDLSTGKYINYLMDDDLFHPQKIEKMMKYFLQYKGISLVTSSKKVIDPDGVHIKSYPTTMLYNKDTIVDGRELSKMMLRDRKDYIGEPTTALFRKEDLKEPFGTFCGIQANNNVDVATWLTLLAKGNAVYLTEPLSSFRVHPNQISRSTPSKLAYLCDWIDHITIARKKGFLKDNADFVQAIINLRKPVLDRVPRLNKKTRDLYINELIKRMRILVKVSERNTSLTSIVGEFKSLLASLENRKNKLRT